MNECLVYGGEWASDHCWLPSHQFSSFFKVRMKLYFMRCFLLNTKYSYTVLVHFLLDPILNCLAVEVILVNLQIMSYCTNHFLLELYVNKWWPSWIFRYTLRRTICQIFNVITISLIISQKIFKTKFYQRPATSHWQTLSHNVISSSSHHEWDLNS
jgi:hypothetical protein